MNSLILPSLLSLALAGTFNVGLHRERSFTSHSRGNNLIREKHIGDEIVTESLANGFYSYYATLYLGSNGQKVTPAIDTGSSDLWVMAESNPYCVSDFNCTGNTFNPKESTTYKNLSKPWDIQYLDTTGAFGWLSQDSVSIGGADIKDAYFAIANVANSTSDVFGVGLTGSEATNGFFRNGTQFGYTYPNIPILLKQQGFIDHIGYSLYLNSIDSGDGNILFGGVDRAKYSGELGIVPLVNTYRGFINQTIEFTIMLDGINLRNGENTCPFTDIQLPVLLDSGTSYALLPPSIIANMGNAMGYSYNSSIKYWTGSCNTAYTFDSFELDFSGIKLQVPPATLLDKATDLLGNAIYGSDGTQLCMIAIEGSDDIGDLILGDVFLRNFYVVYDLENLQVALAQTKFNVEESDVVPIVSDIPDATTAPGYSKTAFVKAYKTFGNYSRCQTVPTASASSLVAKSSQGFHASVSSHKPVVGANSAVISSGAAGAGAASGAAQAVATATNTVKYTTIECSSPTTIAYNSNTYTVTEATTLTVEDCGCTETPSAPATKSAEATKSSSQLSETHPSASATTIVTLPSPTVLSTNGQVFTVTEATVLTITDCSSTATESATAASGTVAKSSIESVSSAEESTPGVIEASHSSTAKPSHSAAEATTSSTPTASASPETVKSPSVAKPSTASTTAPPVAATPSVAAVGSTSLPALANKAAHTAIGGLSGLLAAFVFLL